jgi:GT2 family glycosyltransferase
LVRSPRNLGFTGGNNEGIRKLLDAGADAVWVLNNDTVVDRRCLGALLEELGTANDLAAVTGKIRFQDPPETLWYAGATWHPVSFYPEHRGKHQKDAGQYDQPEDATFVSGCCMLLPRAALEKVGLFDDRFFAFYEDLDWSLRARKAGLRLRYAPRALLWHRVSASVRKQTAGTAGGTTTALGYYLSTRNLAWVIRTHAPGFFRKALALTLLGGRIAALSPFLLVLGRWGKLAAVWRGLSHGVFGVKPVKDGAP